MASPADLEMLKSILSDKKVTAAVGVVEVSEPSPKLSRCLARVKVLPDGYKVVAEASNPLVAPGAGVVQLPQPGDFVLLLFTTEDEKPYIVARLNSPEDTLPKQAILGHLVLRAIAGKTARLESDSKVVIGKGGLLDPTEPLVLGNVLKSQQADLYDKIAALSDRLDELTDMLMTGPIAMTTTPGNPAPTYPGLVVQLTAFRVGLAADKAALVADKATYVTVPATNFVSQLAFTER